MKSVQRVWTNPILIDETGTILAGHGRLEAAKRAAVSVGCIRSAFSNIPGAFPAFVSRNDIWPEGIRSLLDAQAQAARREAGRPMGDVEPRAALTSAM